MKGYGRDPWPDEKEKAPAHRPASLQSGLSDVESLVGDRYMAYDGRREMQSEGQRRRRSVDDEVHQR